MRLPDSFVLPQYGRSTLAELLPSIAAELAGTGENILGVPASERYVVLMVDGLGWNGLTMALPELGYFPELLGDAVRLTSAVPSTTVTSLTTLGTGLTPGEHGIVGYSFAQGNPPRLLNPLNWTGEPDPVVVQPADTVFQTLASTGVAVHSVAPMRFEASGLTGAALRGPVFHGVAVEDDLSMKIDLTARASLVGDRNLVYLYERSLDHVGHGRGSESDAWLDCLQRIDTFVERLREALHPDVTLLITGDHGMVDVPSSSMIMVEDEAALLADVALFAGEGRLRQLYTRRPEAVAARWAGVLGERAVVFTAEEAIAANWFGPINPEMRPRIGDVLVAMRDNWAVMSRNLPGELTLVGMHGSLTTDEMHVPLLTDEGWA